MMVRFAPCERRIYSIVSRAAIGCVGVIGGCLVAAGELGIMRRLRKPAVSPG
jgi:hypothetical protein